MPVLFKLVGIQMSQGIKTDMKFNKFDESKGTINIKEVKDFFTELGLAENDQVKFITESQTMSEDKEYKVSKDTEKIVYVFTLNSDIKSVLVEIFKEKGEESTSKVGEKKEDTNISKPIPFEEIKIDDSIIKNSNIETVKLFEEEDFKSLLSIFINNPNMYQRFSSYITSGDVVIESEKFSSSKEEDYSQQLEEIKKLNIKVCEEDITNALNKFNGHLNLTLRYLLYKNSIETESSKI